MARIFSVPPTRRSVKETRSFSLDRDVIDALEATRGDQSTSERANHLLRIGLEQERMTRLEQEAKDFYGAARDRDETKAFQSAALKNWAKE